MIASLLDPDVHPLPAGTKSRAGEAGALSTPPATGKMTVVTKASVPDMGGDTGKPEDDEVFVFPATAAQRRFWLLNQMMPGGNPSLNMPLAVRLRGRLDRRALERAFNEILARHEVLRTVFHTENGKLCRIISPERTMQVPLVDPQDFPPGERAQVADHLLREEAQTPFDLERGPLLRARLVRTNPDEHLLLVTLHHIICDGWSNGVLLGELTTLYSAFVQGRPSPLADLPIQFADFAQWQQEVLDGGGLRPQLDYWRRQLAGPLPCLDLPLDRPRRPARGAVPGEFCWRHLPDPLAALLKTLAQKQGVSGFMLSLAAFGVLLHRYCGGQEDILVSSPSAGRGRSELEGMIGLFANPLLLRMDFFGNPSFGELLARVRGTVLEAFTNADVPFEKLLEADLQPRRLQINFLQQPSFMRAAGSPGMDWEPVPTGSTGGAVTEWTAGVIEGRGVEGTRLFIEYNTGLFEPATIERTLAQFETLLAAVAGPGGIDIPIGSLPLLTAEEGHTLRITRTANDAETSAAPRLLAARWRLSAESVRWVEASCESAGETPGHGEKPGYGPVRPGFRLLVLDARLQPLPAGVAGEIFVAGMPEDTGLPAPAFVEDPRTTDTRLFRTGDAGRYHPNGDVEFLGRADRQFKVNGTRLDLAQIEASLRSHPQIREAVVLPRSSSSAAPGGSEALIAYVQTAGTLPTALVPDTCRTFLRERFTEEMVPGVFTRVERFPLTPDGRLDEAALPVPAAQPMAGADSRADGPFLTIHYQLIEIWQEVLGVRSIGIRDDFFALGGNSLLAMRMLNRIEQNYGKTLPPATLFAQATVEHLSEEIIRIDATANAGKPHALLTIQAGGTRTPMFYLHGDLTGGGYYCLKLSRRLGPDQPFYALPPVDVSTYRERMPSIEEMAAMHVETIRAVRAHGPYVIGGFCLGGLIAYEVARQLTAAGEIVERLLVIDASARKPRLRNLRRMAEWKGRRKGLDGEAQLYLFCRWHFLLARLDRWKGLGVRQQWEIAENRLSGVWSRVGQFFTGKENLPSATAAAVPASPAPEMDEATAAMLGADNDVASAPSSWFDPRWDVPLVFLWAAGGYQVKGYRGAITVLLSHDLNDGPDGKMVRDWKRCAPEVQMRGLTGSHLACITEHVEELADTLKDILDTTVRTA